MKRFYCVLLAGLVVMAAYSSAVAAELKSPESTGSADSKKLKSPGESVGPPTGEPLLPPVGMPIYKPPRRGAPAGRVGGGSRGKGDKLPVIQVLAPDHAGLTVSEAPVLFWHLSDVTDYPIELTLIEGQAVNPLLEKRLASPQTPGIQKIRLADLGAVRLRKGFQYHWFVAVILDPDHRSKDIISGAQLEVVEPTEAQRRNIESADRRLRPHILAEEGFWYDALEAVSDAIDADPGQPVPGRMRKSLLEQVGLRDIVAGER